MHRHKAAQAAVTAFEFLANQSVTDAVETGAVVSFDRAAQQTQFRDLRYQLAGKAVLLEGFAHDRDGLFIDETRDGIFDHALVVAQGGADVKKIEWI